MDLFGEEHHDVVVESYTIFGGPRLNTRNFRASFSQNNVKPGRNKEIRYMHQWQLDNQKSYPR